MRTAEVIAVGSELLLGGRADTNSVFVAAALATVGVLVRFKTVVGDEEEDIAEALRVAAGRADVIVLTGGLGPTRDDRTRQAVARVTRRVLRRRGEAVEAIRSRLAAWGRTPGPAQLRQALLPAGAELFPNPVGTAPGFGITWKRRRVLALPGVSAEAERMLAESVLPELQAGAGARDRILRKVFHTFGLPEAEVDQQLADVARGRRVVVGTLASPLGVAVSVTAVANATEPLQAVLDRASRVIRGRLAPYLYAEDDDTMEAVVGRTLSARGLLLAVAESCTGGLIGHRLTQVPGSSAYLDRVVVSYSNRAKTDLLGVPEALMRTHGAVSAEVAAAMASGVRARSGAAVGLSVTGIAGPSGASAGKPVGLVYVGLDAGMAHEAVAREFRFHGDRQAIKLRSSQAALNVLREWLLATGGR